MNNRIKQIVSLLLISTIGIVFGCSKHPTKLPDKGVPYYKTGIYPIPLSAVGKDTMELQFLGCGGFFVRKNNLAFLTDPFFSFGPIWPIRAVTNVKEKSIAAGLKTIDSEELAQVKAILVSHGHFDHLLDVPHIYEKLKQNKQEVKVLGSATVCKLLEELVEAPNLCNVQDLMTTHDTKGSPFIIGSEKEEEYLRVWSIKARHAPQVLWFNFWHGEAEDCIPKADYDAAHESPMRVGRWKEGQPLAYLVDFMKSGKPCFRIYFQLSASSYPDGFVEKEVLGGKSVDLAILCVASHHYARRYPRKLLAHLKPKAVVMAHWDNFFNDYEAALNNHQTVKGTSVDQFIKILKKSNKKQPPAEQFQYYLPAPGSKATIRY